MILSKDLLKALGLDLNFSKNVIVGGDGTYKDCYTPMADVTDYNFKPMTEKTIKPEESFIIPYADK